MSVPRSHSRNDATTSTARWISSTLFASPIDARTAPTAVWVHSEKRSGVKSAPRFVRHATMRVGSSAKAASDAPGLQKQPLRGDGEKVRRAVCEAVVMQTKKMGIGGNGRVYDRSAGEPRTVQTRQRIAPRHERAEAGRIAEEFVERERREIGGTSAKTQRVTG